MQPVSSNLSRVRVYRQDASVAETEEETIDSVKIGNRVEGPRLGVVEPRGLRASADRDGNYLFQPDQAKFDQVQSFVTAQKTLDLFEEYAGGPIHWAFDDPQLAVIPHAGEGANAYYVRWQQAVNFYYFESRALGKTVQTAQSSDVVAHETGHAILDGLKPAWGQTFDKETRAFHEAFGDCAAMLLAISRPANCAEAVAGDMRGQNCISRIAEEFGTAVRLANRNSDDDFPYLRTAANDFSYVPPEQLPNDGPRDVLTSESHSFCQIFTRAFYTALVNVYESIPGDRVQALQAAGSVMGKLLVEGVRLAAPDQARFADVARGMLRADQLHLSGLHTSALESAFLQAGILSPAPDLDLALLGQPTGRVEHAGLTSVTYLSQRDQPVEFAGRQATLTATAGATLTYDAQGNLVHASQSDFCSPTPSPDDPAAHLYLTPEGWRLEKLPLFVD